LDNTPQTLSTLISTLNEHSLKPNKRLSQNFLIDKNILNNIIEDANLTRNEHVLEIGPGCGALTKALLDQGVELLAVERDHGLYQFLKDSIKNPRLHLFEADFLTFDLEAHTNDIKSLKVVANIPYHITSCIIDKLTVIYEKLDSVTLMVQKEMAERLMAEPGPRNNAFALFVQSYFNIKYLFTVSKNCYYPKPEVSSSVIQLIPKKEQKKPDRQFQTFVKKLFQKRRKMLRSSFSISELEACNISATSRPETLTLKQALDLYIKINHVKC
jgi:16S rRNA (adenine1518-N6/adenine1519-N6)-dimethyltransferase